MAIGVYKITNVITDQIYVGSSIKSIETRWSYHLKDLKANKHHSSKLQNSWNKYGENAFKFEILNTCNSNVVLKLEQYYLDELKPFFNICPTAGNCAGRKFSEESKRKMSESAKKRPMPAALIAQQQKKRPEGYKRPYKPVLIKADKKVTIFKTKMKRGNRVLATSDDSQISFLSLRDAEKFLHNTYKKANKTMIRTVLNTDKKYLDFNWRNI